MTSVSAGPRHDPADPTGPVERSSPAGGLTESLLTCISRAQQDFILGGDVRELFGRLLDDVLTLTDSEYGFIGEVESDESDAQVLRTWAITNIAWTDELGSWFEENLATGLVFSNLDTLFGAVIRTSSPVVANAPSTDPRRGGLPDGHPALDAFLGLPFLLGDRMIGMVGLANRLGGYDEGLIAELQPFLTTCSTIIGAIQSRRERDASRAQLRVSEGRTMAILQSVVDAVIVIDEAGLIETFNQAAERTFGYDVDEVLGRNIHSLISSDHAGFDDPVLAGLRVPIEVLVTGRRKNGSTFPLEISVSETVVDGRRFFVGTCRDLTDKLRAERDIRMYAATIEATPDFVGVARVDGEIVAINRAGREQIGLAPDVPLDGLAIGDIHAPWSSQLVREVGLPAAIRDGAWVGETAFLSPSGDEVPMSQVIVVSKDADGEARLVSTIARDISERKEIERVKGEFVSSVSHELRTPLTSIRGTLGLLASGALGELPETARQMVDVGLANTERLVRLVNDILDFEKVQAGRIELTMIDVDPADIVASARSVVEGAAIEAGVTIELVLPDVALRPVQGEPDRLVQILVNLLGNAVKFSPSGEKVCVVTAQTPGATRFEVIDRGPGIDADLLPTIFEPFHQLDSSDTRAVGGTGLGLAIARSLATAHQGRIEVETEVGAGCRFALVIPAAPTTIRTGLGE